MSEPFFFAQATQFLRPNGRQRKTECPLPIQMKRLYDEMMKHGCEFQVEQLNTGLVSATITRLDTNEQEGSDLDIRITSNGPAVQDGMTEMLLAKSWLRVEGGDDGEQDVDGRPERECSVDERESEG